ncbi:MAG TPA: hypothetical protein VMT22_25005 [Terriglobales bacterium]|jgi:hypothetical protein|nr:hypothetical protein [Terriglobales bacterium]
MNEKVTDRTTKIIALLQEKVRLEPFHRRIFYSVFGILWGSGALWLLIEWFKDPELGAVRTLLQTFSMKVHGATMLVYLALLGSLLTHIRRGTALKANRLSGFSTIALNGILALSGWMLYYASEDAFRQWSSTVHWTIGLASLPLLCGHVLLGRSWTARRLDDHQDALRSKEALRGANRKQEHRRHHG